MERTGAEERTGMRISALRPGPPLRGPFCVCVLRIGLTDKPGSVFEHVHKNEIKRAKDEGIMTQAQLDTIIHPNEYFKRSFLLKQMGGGIKQQPQDSDVKMEG